MIRRTILAALIGLLTGSAFWLPASRVEAQSMTSDVVDISPLDPAGNGQSIALPQNKARIIRLPADARDVLIANPAIADIIIKTPRVAYLVGRGIGSTNAFFFDEGGQEVARLEIRVELDVLAVQEALHELIPASNISVKAVRNNLFLTGHVRSNDVAMNARDIASRFTTGKDSVVSMLTIIEDQQVLLQVRIAEVSRSVVKDLGLDLAGSVKIGDFAAAFAGGNLFLPAGTTTPTFPGYGAATASYVSGGDSLTAAINALERNGLIKTLAEPNLTAISGETANFLAGGEFPIPVAQGNSGAISVTFRQFGVGLNFTPVVLNSGRISLRLSTEVSSPDRSNAVSTCPGCTPVPGLITRRAETTVEIPSGGSLVIAGLLQDDLSTSIEGLPYLKDIPILGPFFRTNAIDRSERELVVAVTAYLVRPIEKKADIQVPGRDIAAPTDYEIFFLGRLEAIYGTAEEGEPAATASLKGPIGYIVK
jgi:pilus assembly protein CpaC